MARVKREWTDAEIAAVAAGHAAGDTWATLARTLGRTPESVRSLVWQMNRDKAAPHKRPTSRAWTTEDDARLLELKVQRVRCDEIARLLNRGYRAVETRYTRLNHSRGTVRRYDRGDAELARERAADQRVSPAERAQRALEIRSQAGRMADDNRDDVRSGVVPAKVLPRYSPVPTVESKAESLREDVRRYIREWKSVSRKGMRADPVKLMTPEEARCEYMRKYKQSYQHRRRQLRVAREAQQSSQVA